MSDHGEAQLDAAIEAVESKSRAEVVVVVRGAAGDYLGHDLLVGAGAALAMLGFELYSNFTFALHWFLILPALAMAAVASSLRAVPLVRGLFISEARKRAAAHEAAAALFFNKGMRHTRERTGLLVFVALLEQQIVLLPDSGITQSVPEEEWEAALRPFARLLDEGGDASNLAAELERLGELLGQWCEARPDDIDELPNLVEAGR